jgi:hypothetical protein
MSLCVGQQWFMFPRSFTATERELLKLHLTVIGCVPCILYSLLFRPTDALYILTVNFYTLSTATCFGVFALYLGEKYFLFAKVTKPVRL